MVVLRLGAVAPGSVVLPGLPRHRPLARVDASADYRPEGMAATKAKLITTTTGAKGSPKGAGAPS